MAIVHTSQGMSLITLDPEGWAELVRERDLEGPARELLVAFHVSACDRRGFELAFRRDETDQTIRIEVTRSEVDACASRLELYQELLARVVCTSCLDMLLPKETAICGACEARSALDVMALAKELHAAS